MNEVLNLTITPTVSDIGGLLQILEYGATAHAALWHCGREEMLQRHQCVWMIARVWARLLEPLPMRPMELHTWTRPVRSGMSRREFDVLCDGRLVAESVQAWILTDINTRHIRNMTTFSEVMQTPCLQEGKEIVLRRPAMPRDLESFGCVTVRREDIDINGHLNNAHYPRYALSVLPPHQVSQLQISYSHECFAGDTIEILGKTEENEAWLQGRVNGLDSFDMQVSFF